ncbi:MAG: MAPEG family protein [Alphaproteobacteria bacterium]
MGHFLTPVLALIIWTFVMWTLMYMRRIPAMNAITKRTQDFIDNPKLGETLPAKARWAADNYNHLHEQPVIFYALMFYLFSLGQTDALNTNFAWGYVALRIIHSLVQITSNKVLLRFGLFAVSSIVLIVMALRAAAHLF